MPLGNLTFLDLVKLRATDPTVATIEEITTFAPELATIMGRTIGGTSTKLPVRRQLPTAAFRNPNEGVVISKSEYDFKEFSLAFLDAQMRVDVAVISADNPKGRLLANEARGAARAAAIKVGSQIWYGNPSPTDKGFLGIQGQVDPSLIVDATGSTANGAASVYFVIEGDQGVELLYGNDGQIGSMSDEWPIQKIYGTDANSNITSYDAFVNSMNGWIGVQVGMSKCVGVIKNLTIQAGKGLSDLLGQQLLSQFPVGMVPTKCFMTRRSRLQLQQSRNAILYQAYGSGAIAPIPTDLAGVPIYVTDSLLNTEAIR